MTAISRAELDLDAMYVAFKAAVGEYRCPCGSTFEFGTFDTLADYAGLNRWLGTHYDNCPDMDDRAELRARVDELRALARAQSEEIRSLNLQLDQARWKKMDDRAELRARVDELRALARAQSEEIRSLNLQLDQARWKKAGW